MSSVPRPRNHGLLERLLVRFVDAPIRRRMEPRIRARLTAESAGHRASVDLEVGEGGSTRGEER